jgi:hypothetical protein
MLANCRKNVDACILFTNILLRLNTRKLSADQFKELVGLLPTVPSEQVEGAVEHWENNMRMGLVTFCQFQTENLFKNLLNVLKLPMPNKLGFAAVARSLLEGLGVSSVQDTLEVLLVPALLRNCLHSNGMHHGRGLKRKIEGVEFTFEDGELVTCTGWDHNVVALEASLSIVNQILSRDEVKAIPGIIKDTGTYESLGLS